MKFIPPSIDPNINIRNIFQIVTKALDVVWNQIENTIESVLERSFLPNLNFQIRILENILYQPNINEAQKFKYQIFFNINQGKYGRQANAIKDITRGTTILRERPLITVPIGCNTEISDCCSFGPILASHLYLALLLIPSTSARIEIFHFFCHTFRFPHEGWPLNIVVHVAAISIILHRIITRTGTDHPNSWDIFQTLLRIPHNTHSIHTLKSFSDLSLTQCRVGLGLFPIASSLNHNCVPNVFVKFSRLSGEPASNSNFQLELVAISDIKESDELTITYGPTGQQSFSFRNQILLKQYQFCCECVLCKEQRKSSNIDLSSHLVSHLRDKLSRIRQDIEFCLECSEQSGELTRDRFIQNQKLCEEILLECQLAVKRYGDYSGKIEECICISYDTLGRIAATLSNYDEGIMWIRKSIDILRNPIDSSRKPHDANDIIILREKMKLVQMLYLANKWNECYSLAFALRNEMKPYVDCLHDQDYLELDNIVKYLWEACEMSNQK